MRKNAFKKVAALALCALTAVPTVACGGSKGEAIDHTKTQIRVYHYNGGYGDGWVKEIKANFEAAMANVSFEEGKMGVQIRPDGDMNYRTAEMWRDQPFDVLFLESPREFYGMMQKGVLEPLDSIMGTPNATDATLQSLLTDLHTSDNNQTLVSKMTQQQIDAYTYGGHYYGLPHYDGTYGIIYNVDLFDKYGLYLAAEPDEDTGDILISTKNSTKSVGPDGVPDTPDDGLPRTYEEFFNLCFEINQKGINPLCWPGQFRQQHVLLLMENLMVNQEGAEQALLNFTFDGTATNLIQFDGNGNILFNEDGTPKTESLDITSANGYELSRKESEYYAMQFMEELLSNTDYYNEADCFGNTTHLEMQQKFLENGITNNRRANAMLVDGVWWEREATPTFDRMTKDDESMSKMNRRFGWMPLPQATEEDAAAIANGTKKSVYLDAMEAVACVKSGLPDGVKNAALALMKYVYTDKALADFTYTTGTTIGVDYLDALDGTKLTPFENSLVDYIKKSDYVGKVSGSIFYAANITQFQTVNVFSCGNSDIVKTIKDGLRGEDYFKDHQRYFKGLAW